MKAIYNTITQRVGMPIWLFMVLISTYFFYCRTLPITYADEFLWIGQSYFFQFLINGDFKNDLWQSYESFEQPKFAEYVYGAWLFPLYLNEKRTETQPFDYTRFLIKNGFYVMSADRAPSYADYHKKAGMTVDDRLYGHTNELMARYGRDILKPVSIIFYARTLNVFLLAAAVMLAYCMVLRHLGMFPALAFFLLYGFNPVITGTGLVAHAEAIILVTFNAALYFMDRYITGGNTLRSLLAFSLCAGLCTATKPNGIMLVYFFIVIHCITSYPLKPREIGRFLLGFMPTLVVFDIFLLLNPYTYTHPVTNTLYMYQSRMMLAQDSQKIFYNVALTSPVVRLETIFRHFFYSGAVWEYNGNILISNIPAPQYVGLFLLSLTIMGLVYVLRAAFKRHPPAIELIVTFILLTGLISFYLLLDWKRYYIQLPFFFALFQTIGFFVTIRFIKTLARTMRFSKLLRYRL